MALLSRNQGAQSRRRKDGQTALRAAPRAGTLPVRPAAAMRWLAIALLLTPGVASAQRILRQNFESKQTQLRLGISDGQARLVEHELSNKFVHAGKQAERMVLRLTGGTFCQVEFPIPKSLLFEDVTARCWVHANRPGISLAARVVLPKEKDPKTGKPLAITLTGSTLDLPDRWRPLEIRGFDRLLERRQLLLQAESKQPVDIREAFIESLILDTGRFSGDLELSVDDLEFGPIVEATTRASSTAEPAAPAMALGPDGQPLPVKAPTQREQFDIQKPEVVGDQLQIGGKPFFLRGIRWTEAPLERMRDAGMNAAFVEGVIDNALYEKAEGLGVKLVPMVTLVDAEGRPTAAEDLNPHLPVAEDPALAVFVGGDLSRGQRDGFEKGLAHVRRRIGSRPVIGDIREDHRDYSRRLDMSGAWKFPLGSSLDLNDWRQHLASRRNFLQPGSYFWTWIQTHPPEDLTRAAFGMTLDRSFAAPIAPQPAQIRLMTYHALAAGVRGIVYSSDRAFAEAVHGRARNLQVALLNLELAMIDGFLARGEPPTPTPTSNPAVGCVSIRQGASVLLILYWQGPNSQYQLGDAALERVKVVVQNASEASQAFLVTPGEIRSIQERQRGLGGIHVTVPEFDTVALVVMTPNIDEYANYQKRAFENAWLAGNWQTELAEIELARTDAVAARLDSLGSFVNAARGLMAEARKYLDEARQARERKDHRAAWLQSSRALRITRRIQQRYWEAAVRDLPTPVSDPYAVSFLTLPESIEFQKALKSVRFGEDRLGSGNFEADGNLDGLGWVYDASMPAGFKSEPLLDHRDPAEGRRYLELRVRPDSPASTKFESGHATLVSPPIRVQPGQFVRITGKVRVPETIRDSVDGAMVWDSLGGETLALRFRNPTGGWKPFTLHRPVHRPGELRLWLSLTGPGSVQFDDLKVETADGLPANLAGRDDRPGR